MTNLAEVDSCCELSIPFTSHGCGFWVKMTNCTEVFLCCKLSILLFLLAFESRWSKLLKFTCVVNFKVLFYFSCLLNQDDNLAGVYLCCELRYSFYFSWLLNQDDQPCWSLLVLWIEYSVTSLGFWVKMTNVTGVYLCYESSIHSFYFSWLPSRDDQPCWSLLVLWNEYSFTSLGFWAGAHAGVQIWKIGKIKQKYQHQEN